MSTASQLEPRKIQGVTYYQPTTETTLLGRDGKVSIPLGEFPIPLLHEDCTADMPSYDAVGRGLYHFLRVDPDAPYADRYAMLLKDAYPHLLAELATHLLMLDNKDVDLPYLDRKINYLKIFSLLEPENYRFPLEIGATFADKALTLAAFGSTTVNLYAANKYLSRAYKLNPNDVQTRHLAGEVCFYLGKYNDALLLWGDIGSGLKTDDAARLSRRCSQIQSGQLPLVPAVDFLQAVGVAMEAYEAANYEEAAAIIHDVIDAVSEIEGLPHTDIYYLLGLCYARLDIPRYAEQYLRQAVELDPGHDGALKELAKLGVL